MEVGVVPPARGLGTGSSCCCGWCGLYPGFRGCGTQGQGTGKLTPLGCRTHLAHSADQTSARTKRKEEGHCTLSISRHYRFRRPLDLHALSCELPCNDHGRGHVMRCSFQDRTGYCTDELLPAPTPAVNLCRLYLDAFVQLRFSISPFHRPQRDFLCFTEQTYLTP